MSVPSTYIVGLHSFTFVTQFFRQKRNQLLSIGKLSRPSLKKIRFDILNSFKQKPVFCCSIIWQIRFFEIIIFIIRPYGYRKNEKLC
jgi:hypothetical protein